MPRQQTWSPIALLVLCKHVTVEQLLLCFSRYITVDEEAGRALYYTFAESQTNAVEHPLVLWLNGWASLYNPPFKLSKASLDSVSHTDYIPSPGWLVQCAPVHTCV